MGLWPKIDQSFQFKFSHDRYIFRYPWITLTLKLNKGSTVKRWVALWSWAWITVSVTVHKFPLQVLSMFMWVSSVFSSFLQKRVSRWHGFATLPLGVNECVCACMLPWNKLASHPGSFPTSHPIPKIHCNPDSLKMSEWFHCVLSAFLTTVRNPLRGPWAIHSVVIFIRILPLKAYAIWITVIHYIYCMFRSSYTPENLSLTMCPVF